jgi:hypothetical protein
MVGELMKTSVNASCDDRGISLISEPAREGTPPISSSFASAETSIPKVAAGFA